MSYQILGGDALTVLRTLPSGHFHCVVTSPPYYAQRKYKAGPAEMGSEDSPEAHVAALVEVFREVRRVLRPDGVCWVNYGDKAAQSGGGEGSGKQTTSVGSDIAAYSAKGYRSGEFLQLPWKLALALREDGWVLHPEIIWHKPAPMPESVSGVRWEQHRVKTQQSDRAKNSFQAGAYSEHKQGAGVSSRAQREAYFEQGNGASKWSPCPGCAVCAPNDGLVLRRGSWRTTRAHEYVFMLTKTERYYVDQDAVRESASENAHEKGPAYHTMPRTVAAGEGIRQNDSFLAATWGKVTTRNPRSVWTIGPEPLRIPHDYTAKVDVAHFAAFPTELPTRCIKASTSERGCCPECGANWARVMSDRGYKPSSVYTDSIKPSDISAIGDHSVGMGAKYQAWLDANPKTTLSWRATCAHGDLPPVPCRVLDPFSGAGTTVLAAVRLGRDATGIELRPEYAAMSRARIVEDAPMLTPERTP